MKFTGGFCKGLQFPFAGLCRGHVQTYLDELTDLVPGAYGEVYLPVVPGAVIEQTVSRLKRGRKKNR